jgi:alpha-ketoglutarate-dependent taurine dioxygenase
VPILQWNPNTNAVELSQSSKIRPRLQIMAPSADIDTNTSNGSKAALKREPLKPNDSLEHFENFEVTPKIGHCFPSLQIKDVLAAPNSDALLQELALTISTRGVVFFKSQDLTLAQQKEFTNRIGILSGRPSTSGLHIPATFNAGQDIVVDAEAQKDPEIFIVSNRLAKKMYDRKTLDADAAKNKNASRGWHTE